MGAGEGQRWTRPPSPRPGLLRPQGLGEWRPRPAAKAGAETLLRPQPPSSRLRGTAGPDGPTLLTDAVVGVTQPHVTSGFKDQTENLLGGERAWLGQREKALGEQAERVCTRPVDHTACALLCSCDSCVHRGPRPCQTRGRG